MSKPKAFGVRGFTIIEVLIVLAMAGLILLMVFEAVPALERNARNGRRKQDITAVLQAVSHYELSNSASFPPDCGGAAPTTCDNAPNFLQYDANKLTFYSAKSVATHAGAPLGSSLAPVASNTTVDIHNYYKCDPAVQGGATSSGAGYLDVVALFGLEAGGNRVTPECQQL